ncbi:hypothetical protein MNBD_GAMMA12-223 [hydrothermal vent metagenome]|uniref:NodB homology domain-containing protein n=1 Tax=hydrothermal vent metagenome TaxID=652676 RepID=A0A3B0Y1I3_9ZZZZ
MRSEFNGWFTDVKRTLSSASVSLLLYHQIGDDPKATTNLDCFCRRENFYSQMAYLKKSAYEVIGLKDAVGSLFVKSKLRNPSVVLTFDDGDTSFFDLALPILQEFEFPSILFCVSGLLGQAAEWIKASARVPIMTAGQLREIHALGVDIGSHSINHPRLTQLNEQQVLHEVYESKKSLENIIDSEIVSFAYPHGDYNPMVIDAVKKSGYHCAVSCLAQVANRAPSPFEIPRKYITYHDDLGSFISKLSS